MKILLVGEGASELAGALETLVRRLGLAEAEIDRDRVSNPAVHAHHGKGKGYFKRCIRWMLEAKKRGYDALILVIDQDGLLERTRELNESQESAVCTIQRALGVAIQTFDVWMLADEAALTKVIGTQISRQPNPEDISDPKNAINCLLNGNADAVSIAELYKRISSEIDLELLQSRYEKGFAVFARRVRVLTLCSHPCAPE
jgi:hypothetical protein